jgi:hypothetical protein
MVAMTTVFDWRIAFLAAAALEASILLMLWLGRDRLVDDVQARRQESETKHAASNPSGTPLSTFGFMRLPVVWLCWIFFFFSMAATSGLQSFAPTALFEIYDLAVSSGNYYLTLLSMGGAGGMLLGAYLATRLKVPERIIRLREIFDIYYRRIGVLCNMIAPQHDSWIPWFVDIFVNPAASDTGIPLGAALHGLHNVLGVKRDYNGISPFLGPTYSIGRIQKAVSTFSGYRVLHDGAVDEAVKMLAANQIIVHLFTSSRGVLKKNL